jgi:rod shape-determining protein MreC
VAVFGTATNRSFGGRGPSFGVRYFCYAVISVVLMFYDRRGSWLDSARYGLQAAVYPLQLAVNSPSAAWRWLEESFATRETLQKEVDGLRNQLRDQQLMTMRQSALQAENATLRGLNGVLPEVIEKRLVGEVINVEVSTLRQRLLVNRGGRSGVFRAQPVITGQGVIGQVYRIGPYSSEIILITDAEHALPVQVLRSGVRTIALGTGHSSVLELPYVPLNYDVQVGDVLVTSGLGQVFPYGLPVARVTKVTRDPTQPLAQIRAVPLATIDSDREVLFIWGRPGHPAAPASNEALAIETADSDAATYQLKQDQANQAAAKPQAVPPATTKPSPNAAPKPAAAKPAISKPAGAKPAGAKPAGANPAAAKPAPITPDVPPVEAPAREVPAT